MSKTFPTSADGLTTSDDDVPRPPRLRPTWTTWMWLAFAVLTLVLTVIGMLYAAGPTPVVP